MRLHAKGLNFSYILEEYTHDEGETDSPRSMKLDVGRALPAEYRNQRGGRDRRAMPALHFLAGKADSSEYFSSG
jgi:hypothetical protein